MPPKIYLIHENGGRPFRVVLTKDSQTGKQGADIYKKAPKDDEYDDSKYSKFVAHIPMHAVYVGKSSGSCESCDHTKQQARQFDGNSLLLHMIGNDYVYVGESIYAFTLAENETVEHYYSPVGNNDVPYPMLVTNLYVYFMLDKKRVPREHFPKDQVWEDAYKLFYGTFEPREGWTSRLDPYKKRFRTTQIHKRLY